MAMLGVFASIRGKTLLYFSVVLSLSIVITGGACYYFFSKSYRRAMESQNNIRLTALSNQLDNQVYQFTKHQLVELTQNSTLYQWFNSFLKDPGYDRNIKIVNVVSELKSLVTFSGGIIGSVDIYCPESELSISSYSGYTDLFYDPARIDRQLWEDVIRNWKQYQWWDVRQINSHQSSNIVYLGSVPGNAVDTAKSLIALSLNPSVFASYLAVMETGDTQIFLFNDELVPFYGDMTEIDRYLTPEQLRGIAHSDADGFVHQSASMIPGTMVSYIRSAEIPAILLSVVSTNVFRKGMNEIMVFVILVGTVVLCAGFIASGFLSGKLYSPLRQLMVSVENLPQKDSRELFQNEYSYINHAIERLSGKASEYEKTFTDNFKIMRYGFLQSLFNRQFSTIDEIRAKAQFLNLMIDGPHYRMIKVYLSRIKKSAANHDLIAYNILTHAEALGGPGSISLCGIKNTDLSLVILCSYGNTGPFLLNEALEEILRYCREFFSIPAQICISGQYDSLDNVYQNNQELRTIEPYLFFCPERSRLGSADIPALTAPKELPLSLEDDFEAALTARSLEDLLEILDRFKAMCASLEYSSESCHQYLLRVEQLLSHYLRKHKADTFWDKENMGLEHCENVGIFCNQVKDAAVKVFELIAGQGRNQTALLTSKLLEYINANYSTMISLDSTAEQFNISSSYVRKLLKEETGDSFVDYLNNRRLDAAMTLLANSTLKIDDVAKKTGFNGAAYFIKRFNERFGMTPKAYRIQKSFPDGPF
jgi:AraC-like DNA-binding protein/DNA-dependent RNA polymerase auxiliary subunit epsilon